MGQITQITRRRLFASRSQTIFVLDPCPHVLRGQVSGVELKSDEGFPFQVGGERKQHHFFLRGDGERDGLLVQPFFASGVKMLKCTHKGRAREFRRRLFAGFGRGRADALLPKSRARLFSRFRSQKEEKERERKFKNVAQPRSARSIFRSTQRDLFPPFLPPLSHRGAFFLTQSFTPH